MPCITSFNLHKTLSSGPVICSFSRQRKGLRGIECLVWSPGWEMQGQDQRPVRLSHSPPPCCLRGPGGWPPLPPPHAACLYISSTQHRVRPRTPSVLPDAPRAGGLMSSWSDMQPALWPETSASRPPEKGSRSFPPTPSRPHVTPGAFPRASVLPGETVLHWPWVGALPSWAW